MNDEQPVMIISPSTARRFLVNSRTPRYDSACVHAWNGRSRRVGEQPLLFCLIS